MAGVKGKSGGPRPNSGRKPDPPRITKAKGYETTDPDDFLRTLMSDSKQPMKDRIAAAMALKKEGKAGVSLGKKAQQEQDAKEVVGRSLAPMAAPTRPQLRSVK